MARLRDFYPVVQRVGFFGFLKRVWQQCHEDGIFTWGSAMAYAWLFAIFPFFLILLSLVPYIPNEGKEWLKSHAQPVLEKSLPRDAYQTVWEGYLKDRMGPLLDERPKAFLSFGLVLTIWAASGGMAVTINALDKCYDLDKSRPYVRVRLLAIFVTLIVASLLLVVIIALPVASTVRSYIQNYLSNLDHPIQIPYWGLIVFDIARFAIALVCMCLALSVMYHLGPFVKHRYRFLTPGSVFCVIVWLSLGALFRLYVNTFGRYQQMYGPVGGVVILLLFFYLDAVVLLIGAEINSEIDFVAFGVQPGCQDFRGKPWEHEKLSATVETESASTG
jgi:membrane protein